MNKVETVTPRSGSLAFATPGGIYNATPPRIVFGAGSVNGVADEVRRLGAKRAVVISTPGRQEMAKGVGALLGDLCVGYIPEAISQVPIELAHRGRAKVLEMDADCLVSVGGGASVGLGKAIALELALPIINIPTTYSGSEMTGFCGITIDGVKRMHTSLNMLAKTVIYDPELTLSLPISASASSALNALAHCIDGVYVPTISPMVMLTAAAGTRAIIEGLRRVVKEPGNLDARTQLLYGGYLGGGMLTGGFALQHGLAHTLGGSFGVPHGSAHAVSLPYVTAYNARFAREKLAPIEAELGAATLAGAVWDLLADIGLPTKLTDVGIQESDIDEIVRITVETDNGLNPCPVTTEAVRGVTLAAYAGKRPA
jgi:alcohol dehydrogenase class IV